MFFCSFFCSLLYTELKSKIKTQRCESCPVFYLLGVCECVFILHVLVGPLGSDGVLVEKSWDPWFVSSLFGLSPLSFLQHKLFLGGLKLVPFHDGPGHMLPQSVRSIFTLHEHLGRTYCASKCCIRLSYRDILPCQPQF